MNKVSVENFIKVYNSNKKAKGTTFDDFIKKHIVNDYVPILEKEVICTNIVNATCHIQDGERQFVKINSVAGFLLFTMKVLECYTDLDIDFTDANYVIQYDELKKCGAIDCLNEAIPESEYTEFMTILKMKMDDFRDNEYSIQAILYNMKNSFALTEEVINSALE